MNPEVLLAEKVAISAGIGLLIGLEREWKHMELGVRSFTIAALLGTLAWVVSPTFALVEVGIVAVIIVLANVYLFSNKQPVELTTALALGVTNVLGVLIGSGYFFLPLASAIVISALLSWKNELIEFTSKLTLAEIRGTLLMAFIAAVIYPLLPPTAIDPWKIIIPRSIWLTVIVVSGLSFINCVLLRQYGVKGMRYSAILGGFVNSAAVSMMLGQHLKTNPDTSETVPTNFMLGDLAMIFRNGLLVVIFSWPAGLAATYAVLYVIGPMILLAALLALFSLIRSAKTIQQTSQDLGLKSPLALRSVFRLPCCFSR
jgi:uncharacterized membrane protein (DUF4010 family)